MKRLAALTGAVALVLAIPAFPSASAAGAAITQIGWWSQRPGATEQPQGGFEIALGPTGPLSQAALRIQVDTAQLNSALLELTESTAAGAAVASVVVCPTTDAWEPANPGPWNEAPTPNCNKNVPLSRRSSGEWAGDISEVLAKGSVSVVLVPMSSSDTRGAPLPYQLVFSGAKLSASAPSTPAPAPPTTTLRPGDNTPPVRGQPRVVAAPDNPPSGSGTGPPPVVVDPNDDTDEDESSFAVDNSEDGGSARPWWRLAILVPLAALLGGGTVFAKRVARERGWVG